MNEKLTYIASMIAQRPNSIGIELTTYCPLHCIYCTREDVPRKNRNLSLQKFNELKNKIAKFDHIVICGIGEPMVYPHIYEVIPQLKQRILLITCGAVEIDYKKLNRKRNVDVIIFSVDEPTPEGMAQIAGSYNWDNLIQNFENSQKAKIMVTMINCTVNRFNYKNIPKLVELAKQYRIKAINFTLDINKEDLSGVDQEELNRCLTYTAESNLNQGIMISNSVHSLKCVSWERVLPYISLEGDVYPCCIGMKEEYKMGNIFSASFDEIWDKESYQDFRNGDFCKECSMLLDYERITS